MTLLRSFSMLILPLMFLCGMPHTGSTTENEPYTPLEIAEHLQSTYEGSTGLTARFRQVTTMQFTQRQKEGSGTVTYLKPGLMRWDYVAPDRQVLISDGEKISMYFAKTRQMIVTSAKEYLQSDVTYSFFSGTGNITKDFTVSKAEDMADDDGSGYVIKLVPKRTHPHISRLYVWVDAATWLITRIRIIDHFDTTTDLFFDDVHLVHADKKTGPAIDKKMFLFIPPAGTEIINQ
jgi:outer membrane lipoprotein carrier protein